MARYQGKVGFVQSLDGNVDYESVLESAMNIHEYVFYSNPIDGKTISAKINGTKCYA